MSLQKSRFLSVVGVSACALALAIGCAATPPAPVAPVQKPLPPPEPQAPVASAVPAPPADPFAVPGSLQKETIPTQSQSLPEASKLVLPALKTKGAKKEDPQAIDLPAPPAECNKYLANKTAANAKCETRSQALGLLNEALGEAESLRRDFKLSALEGCAGLPKGLVRALRADLAPAECGDVLVAPVLSAKTPPAPEVHQVLVGLGIGARLRRAAQGEPKLTPPFEKQRVAEFIKGPVALWIASQAKAVEQLSRAGADLSGYARGIVAVEAGMADMRLVEAVRAVPLPEEFAKDTAIKDTYLAGIEQGLDPRKARGRDAALVGLRDLASVGVISDPRVDRARGLLSKVFGGRRIDALDTLLLPPLPPGSPTTLEQSLAARLPTFYAGQLLAADVVKDPTTLRQLVLKGVPAPQRLLLQQSKDLPRDVEMLTLRARLALGQRYWRGVDFDEATALAVKLRGTAGLGDETTFLLALSLALRGGPRDAAEMMFIAPALSLGIGNTAALDAVANANPAGAYSGLAALDAALILQVSPSVKPDAAFWTDLAGRYRKAATLLSDPAQRSIAEQRARAAEEVAKAAPALN